MFVHNHPYEPFLYKGVKKIIMGTIPPPRFSGDRLNRRDVNFGYGSRDNLLWRIFERIFNYKFSYRNTSQAIKERELFLKSIETGICDMVARCERNQYNASDGGMKNIQLRDILYHIKNYSSVNTILFTGAEAKNSPEKLFHQYLKSKNIKVFSLSDQTPRTAEFSVGERTFKTIALTSPSGSANRAIGCFPAYKKSKAIDPHYNTFDFRVDQYRLYFWKNRIEFFPSNGINCFLKMFVTTK